MQSVRKPKCKTINSTNYNKRTNVVWKAKTKQNTKKNSLSKSSV